MFPNMERCRVWIITTTILTWVSQSYHHYYYHFTWVSQSQPRFSSSGCSRTEWLGISGTSFLRPFRSLNQQDHSTNQNSKCRPQWHGLIFFSASWVKSHWFLYASRPVPVPQTRTVSLQNFPHVFHNFVTFSQHSQKWRELRERSVLSDWYRVATK